MAMRLGTAAFDFFECSREHALVDLAGECERTRTLPDP
jgi:hypothetical protein